MATASGPTRILLTGADGLLGTALRDVLARDGDRWQVHGVSKDDFDIADAAAVHGATAGFRPHVVVHSAAHAVVDDCEHDPALALRVNVAGVRNVVAACRRTGARLIHLSSDYVFDGAEVPPGGYREEDVPCPLNVYGLTKLAGERQCALLGTAGLSVRTSWLFGGDNPRVDNVLAALVRARRGEPAGHIADQYSRPTSTADLAEALVRLLAAPEPVSGTLHIANEGTASWYEVALALRELYPRMPEPKPLSTAEAGFAGERPRDSTLSTDRLAGLGMRLPHWRDALERYCRTLEAAGSAALGGRPEGRR
ncbi:dTDP-4-dehydrorhamnose reductase [Streptomyces sp. WMMB303]|uniref:dTDP-4-dehydrorhamnose reductase n=1 Tax=Streptomyces sp. WMMB303 TaxID=3034154 RepID=UPI0023EC5990|nr:dTDP-4-dehydrorhamnose reductase [Streptomyces sp. WMMB303]MDF4251743.1 dTDP-4-dehydrorhamnose reductase [Streptomyces sp. WMMB303]